MYGSFKCRERHIDFFDERKTYRFYATTKQNYKCLIFFLLIDKKKIVMQIVVKSPKGHCYDVGDD